MFELRASQRLLHPPRGSSKVSVRTSAKACVASNNRATTIIHFIIRLPLLKVVDWPYGRNSLRRHYSTLEPLPLEEEFERMPRICLPGSCAQLFYADQLPVIGAQLRIADDKRNP